MNDHELWGLTCYFNPCAYSSRRNNFQLFRQWLDIPLVCVELSFGGEWELTESDAEILVRVREADLMWQKEKLLNIALEQVPLHVQKIAWLDCDVVFADPEWHVAASRRLEDCRLVHLFETAFDLTQQETNALARKKQIKPDRAGRSAMAAWSSGDVNREVFEKNMRLERLHTGLAWAGRREMLAKTGFFDECVMGSGNRAMACAALGHMDQAVRYLHMNVRQTESYHCWAEQHFRAVNGAIGILPQMLYHLWHGELAHRQYGERHHKFSQFRFDPTRDLKNSSEQCWKWNTPKFAMHDFVRQYLRSRREDGE